MGLRAFNGMLPPRYAQGQHERTHVLRMTRVQALIQSVALSVTDGGNNPYFTLYNSSS